MKKREYLELQVLIKANCKNNNKAYGPFLLLLVIWGNYFAAVRCTDSLNAVNLVFVVCVSTCTTIFVFVRYIKDHRKGKKCATLLGILYGEFQSKKTVVEVLEREEFQFLFQDPYPTISKFQDPGRDY